MKALLEFSPASDETVSLFEDDSGFEICHEIDPDGEPSLTMITLTRETARRVAISILRQLEIGQVLDQRQQVMPLRTGHTQ